MPKPKISQNTVFHNLMDFCILTKVDIDMKVLERLCKLWFSLYIKLKKNYGKGYAVKELKNLYNEGLRFSLRYPNCVEPCTASWLKRDKDNFPKVLKPFKEYLIPEKKGIAHLRVILSILRSYELFKCSPKIDFYTILEESKGTAVWSSTYSTEFQEFLEKSLFSRRIKETYIAKYKELANENLTDHAYHFSNRSGVHGKVFTTLHEDAICLLHDRERFEATKTLAMLFNIVDFEETLNASLLNLTEEEFHKGFDLGRLVFIPDKGCKTRIVAIGNYWIQEVLKQIHITMFSVLRTLGTDGTFDQAKAANAVREASGTTAVWSFDLTAATDRVPLIVQKQIMEFLDPAIGKEWSNIMEGYPYYNVNAPFDGYFSYKVGQGMGLYSSWTNLAFFNHFIVQFGYYLGNKKKIYYTSRYRVLGDDIAIWSNKAAEQYRKIITDLDISISEQKSFTPDSPKVNSCIAEFAKRIYKDGQEWTPVPPVLLKESFENITDIPNLLDQCRKQSLLIQANAPGPEIVKILQRRKVNEYKIQSLLVLLKVRSLFTGLEVSYESIKDNEYDPNKHYRLAFDPSKLTSKFFINIRMEKLLQQIRDIINKEDNLKVDLARILGSVPEDNSIWMKQYDGIERRLLQMKDDLYELAFVPLDDVEEEDADKINAFFGFMPAKTPEELLKEIEYIPILDVNSLAPKERPLKPQIIRKILFSWCQEIISMSTPEGEDIFIIA